MCEIGVLPTAQCPLAEHLIGPASYLLAADVCLASGACTGWREALVLGRAAAFTRWQPLLPSASVFESDAAAWCIIGGIVHLQGKVELTYSVKGKDAGGCTVCVLPPEACPKQQLFFEQARARERDNVRLTVHTDGRLRLRPAHSTWLMAMWRSAATHELLAPTSVSLGDSLLEVTLLGGGTSGVHLAGCVRPEQLLSSMGTHRSTYVSILTLPEGILCSEGFRHVRCHQARSTEGLRSCFWIGADREIQVSKASNNYATQVACTFYAGNEYEGLQYDSTFSSILAPGTTLGVAFADGLVYLQGMLELTLNCASGPFMQVGSLPACARPARMLVLHLVEASDENAQKGCASGGSPWATRLEVRTDGSLWLRPARSVWIAAAWKPGLEHCIGSTSG